jgi:hypothetical protein
MTPVEDIYQAVAARMPHHAGSMERSALTLPATALAQRRWWRDDLTVAQRQFGRASDRTLGTVRWYSVSSVLVAPVLESLVLAGVALDPALDAVTLDAHEDGRLAGARSTRVLGDGSDDNGDIGNAGAALGTTIDAVVTAVADATGASARSLWAIATDSIANRLLWAATAAGDPERAVVLARELADVIGPRLPPPRFTTLRDNVVVRRASCCLLYEVGAPKCVSCPRQPPQEREHRLRDLFG